MSSLHQGLHTRIPRVKWRVIVGAIAGAALVAGCGATVSSTTTSAPVQTAPPATPTQTFSTTTTSTATSAPAGPTGTTFTDTDTNGNVMAVKLMQVTDPAQGADTYITPNNGFHFVGAKFRITGTSGTFSSDANNDAALVGSDGQTYTSDFSNIAGCTNFNSGSYTVSAGVSTTGCVTFQVPQHVQVASVQWGGKFGGAPATWTP